MKNISIVLRAMALVALVALSSAVSAQVLRSGYFIDGNPLRYRINPALKSARGHFSLPLLGGVNVNTSGNVGLADFLYKSADGDGLVTFMHPSVEAGDFLASIERDNRVVLDMDLTLFSLAFHAFGGFNSVDFTFRSMTGVSLPYDMLRFMKVAGEGVLKGIFLNQGTNPRLESPTLAGGFFYHCTTCDILPCSNRSESVGCSVVSNSLQPHGL